MRLSGGRGQLRRVGQPNHIPEFAPGWRSLRLNRLENISKDIRGLRVREREPDRGSEKSRV